MADTSGKTLADVLDSILVHPARLLSFILMVAAMTAIVFAVIFLFQKLMGVSPSEITLSPTGTTQVIFSTAAGKNKEYLIMVHPQGWQNTRVHVSPGDHLSFAADGSVNINLEAIIENAQLRNKFEDAVAAKHGLKRDSLTEVPERYFDEGQKKALKPASPWVGPDGYDDVVFTAWTGRIKNRVLPDQPAGALIGAVSDSSGKSPDQAKVFMIGRGNHRVSAADGDLWLNVNDVRDVDDPSNPNLFYIDNIGFFWVKVAIEPKGN